MSDDRGDGSTMGDRSARSGRLVYIASLVVALVIFELTADSSLVIVVGCSKFGWAQLRTARWLRKIDPNRARGRACRWFYVSWGLWRISIVSAALMMVIAMLLANVFKGRGRLGFRAEMQGVVAMAMAFFGFALSMVASAIGVISAWRGRVRVWVGREAIEARSERRWPPSGNPVRSNRLYALLFSAVPALVIVIVLPMAGAVLMAISLAIQPIWGEPAKIVAMLVGMWGTLLGGVVGLLKLLDAAKARIIANSPADCWPDQDAMPPSSNQSTIGSALR